MMIFPTLINSFQSYNKEINAGKWSAKFSSLEIWNQVHKENLMISELGPPLGLIMGL
jgi:hypothetical protein